MRINIGEWILNSSVLILMVLLIRRVFQNRLRAKVRYGIWLLVLLRLLLPFSLFDNSFRMINFFPGQESEAGTQLAESFGQSPTELGITLLKFFTEPDQVSQMFVSEMGAQIDYILQYTQSGPADAPVFGNLLFLFWTVGMAVTLLIIAGCNLYFISRVRKTRQQMEVLQNKSSPPVYLSEAIPMPCMFGLLQPAVYVRNRDTDNKEYLSYILKHEYTHYRHRDNVWAFLRGLCLILHWYNPLVWIAAYCSKQDGELACDESVIRRFSAEEAEGYGKVLISLSTQKTDCWTVLSCATTFGGGKRYLKERIKRIAERPRLCIFSTAAAIVFCIAALLITFTGDSEFGSDPFQAVTNRNLVVIDDMFLINDYSVDMNGDGVKDVLRVERSIDQEYAPEVGTSTGDEALRKAMEEDTVGYHQISLYYGTSAADMRGSQVGNPLKQKAWLTFFELERAYVVYGQCCYYDEDGKEYQISRNLILERK